MNGFFTIFKNDLRIYTKNAKLMILLLVAPLLVLFVIAAAMAPMLKETDFVKPFGVTLTDHEQSLWSSLLEKQLKQISLIDPVLLLEEEDAKRAIIEGRAKAGIVVPEGLAESINWWSPVAIKIYGSRGNYLENTVVRQIGELGTEVVNNGIAALSVIRAWREPVLVDESAVMQEINDANEAYIALVFNRLSMIDATVSGKDQKMEMNPIGYFAASLIPIFLLLSALPIMKMMQQDRACGVLQRYQSTGGSMAAMVSARITLSFLVGFIQIAIVLGVVQVYYQPLTDNEFWPLLLLLSACMLAAASFAMFISSMASTHAAIDMIAYPGVLLMAVAGGSIYPLQTLPEWVLPISNLLPTRWGMVGFLDLFSGYTERIPLTALRLVLMAGVMFIAAIMLDVWKRRAR